MGRHQRLPQTSHCYQTHDTKHIGPPMDADIAKLRYLRDALSLVHGTVLYCIILYCTVLYSTLHLVMYSTALHSTLHFVLYCAVLYSTAQPVLYCDARHTTVWLLRAGSRVTLHLLGIRMLVCKEGLVTRLALFVCYFSCQVKTL